LFVGEKEKRREYYQRVTHALEVELERFKHDIDVMSALHMTTEKEKLRSLEEFLQSNIAKLKQIKEHFVAGNYVRNIDEELLRVKKDLLQVLGVPPSSSASETK
jgi:hypothetical protein